jgi:hypothetical protein
VCACVCVHVRVCVKTPSSFCVSCVRVCLLLFFVCEKRKSIQKKSVATRDPHSLSLPLSPSLSRRRGKPPHTHDCDCGERRSPAVLHLAAFLDFLTAALYRSKSVMAAWWEGTGGEEVG